MATVKLCDRCRKEAPIELANEKWCTISLYEPGFDFPMTRDLCLDCVTAYRKFIAPLPRSG